VILAILHARVSIGEVLFFVPLFERGSSRRIMVASFVFVSSCSFVPFLFQESPVLFSLLDGDCGESTWSSPSPFANLISGVCGKR
jgi:hypothetical protein